MQSRPDTPPAAEAPPGPDARRRRIWAVGGGTLAVVLLLGLLWAAFSAMTAGGPGDDGAVTGTSGATARSGTAAPPPGAVRLAPIGGVTITGVAASLTKRWHVRFRTGDAGTRLATAHQPGTGHPLEIAVIHYPDIGDNQVGAVQCAFYRDYELTPALVRAVTDCLRPVLSGADRTRVPAWIAAHHDLLGTHRMQYPVFGAIQLEMVLAARSDASSTAAGAPASFWVQAQAKGTSW